MKIKINLKFITILFYLILIFGGYFYFNENKTQLSITNLENKFLIFVVILKLFNFFIFNRIHLEIFQIFNLHLSQIENFKLTFKGYIGNFFGFGKSGTTYKALFLKNKYQFSFIKFFSFYIFLQTLTIFFTSLVCFFALFLLSYFDKSYPKEILIVLFLVMLLCFLSNYLFKLITKIKLLENSAYFRKWIFTINEVLQNLKNIKYLNIKILKIILFQAIIQFNIFLQIYFLSKALNFNITLISNLIFNLISQISSFISLTPNALGIKEFILFTLNEYIGLSSFLVLELAVLDRLTDFFSLVFFSIIYRFILKIYENE